MWTPRNANTFYLDIQNSRYAIYKYALNPPPPEIRHLSSQASPKSVI